MAEGGDPRKGPHSLGLRLQDTLRVGPLKVEAVAAQVRLRHTRLICVCAV